MPNDLIRYDLLVQEALCGVVKKVLGDVARHGLPGDHHFYITFRTHAPGVRLSTRMREQYPEEMTIILQHQFEDLKVTDYAFEVGLSFKGVPEILMIPFEALTGFFDPSVQFSAKFEPQSDPEGEAGEPGAPATVTQLPGLRALPAPAAPPAGLASVPQTGPKLAKPPAVKPPVSKAPAPKPPMVVKPDPEPADASAEAAAGATKVVSIDSFRKKP